MRSASVSYYLYTILVSPLEVLFTLLIFILSVSLGATPFQLMIMTCLKPITSFVSFYLGALLSNSSFSLRRYLIVNLIVGTVPCIFFPFVNNVWYYIASYALFMITLRAAYPAWIEILKRHTELQNLSHVVSRGNSIYYGVMILFPPLIAVYLDQNPLIWKIIFITCAISRILSILVLSRIEMDTTETQNPKTKFNLKKQLFDPLYKGFQLLKKKPQFGNYLALFFIGGAGIIGIQSILPIYFKKDLHLSYTELAMAFSFCKGVSFITTSSIWAKFLNRSSIFMLNSFMNLFSCLFLALITASSFETSFLYPAYLFYGVMQAGCQISWNMSGAIFSDSEESSFYSSMNLALVGVRGIICPAVFFVLFSLSNANIVFLSAFILCFLGILYGVTLDRRYTLSVVAQ